jgi:hypothetical protein
MPLRLTDPRWSELRSSYDGTEDIVTWLTEAYQEGGLSRHRFGDLINEVKHQGGTSTAMYAVAGHLIELGRRASSKDALPLLIHAGFIYAVSDRPDSAVCPSFLREEFTASASEGAKLLSQFLPLATDFDTYKWAVAGLAGFLGYHSFARFLDGLDLYEGRFHHTLLDDPFPSDV